MNMLCYQVILSTWRRKGGLVVERMAVAQEIANQQVTVSVVEKFW